MAVLRRGRRPRSRTSSCSRWRPGPGRSPGLRVGIATMQGLALARGRRDRPGLDARSARVAAPAGAGDGSPRGWTRSAARSSRSCSRDEAGRARAADRCDRGRTAPWSRAARAAGCAERVRGRRRRPLRATSIRGGSAIEAASTWPTGAARWRRRSGVIAAADPGRAVLPHALVPFYVRRPDVELARDRRAGA